MQQILLCPHGQSSSFYYKRRLGVFNFTIFDYKESDGFCFMWPEHEAQRGSNEVSTCLFEYIREQASKGVNRLKCSQTIEVDKTATGSLHLPYGMLESIST